MAKIRFDDSLGILARVVAAELGKAALTNGTVLRDSIGCLAFFASTPLDETTSDRLSTHLRAALGAYARADRVVAGSQDYGADAVRGDPSVFTVTVGGDAVRLVDRRLVGVDWLRAPVQAAPPPTRLVFASLKGGVGRSTALAVVAAHLAARGRRVLAVDLDMEAPGLGALLLTPETLPEFGMIDALVESKLSGLDDEFWADLIGPSALAAHAGRIDVIPALGRRSLNNPADVLAKIARAYAEGVQPDGTVATILDQVRAIIDHYAEPTSYDAILIDARAGLHETTASAVLGLGAEVLLFGLDEPQTFQGYEVMLAHLARFLRAGDARPEWLERLTMVQGKAPTDSNERAGFALRCQELFAKSGLGLPEPEATDAVPLPAGSFKDVPWDDAQTDEEVLPRESILRPPLAVLNDPRFQRFDPLRRRDLLADAVYQSTFSSLLTQVDSLLFANEENP